MEHCLIVVFLISIFLAPFISGSENEAVKQAKNVEDLRQMVLQLRVQLQEDGHQCKSDIALLKAEIAKLRQTKSDDHSIRMLDKRLLVGSIDAENVAFYAYIKTSEPIQQHKTLIFDVPKLNIGHAYNNNTGVFTALRSGLYILTFTVHSYSQSYASVQLVINNAVDGTIYTDNNYSAATSVVPVWLNQGDVAHVRTHPTYPSKGSIRSDDLMRSSFAGWKV